MWQLREFFADAPDKDMVMVFAPHRMLLVLSCSGEQDGECFYVMELAEGETLEQRAAFLRKEVCLDHLIHIYSRPISVALMPKLLAKCKTRRLEIRQLRRLAGWILRTRTRMPHLAHANRAVATHSSYRLVQCSYHDAPFVDWFVTFLRVWKTHI